MKLPILVINLARSPHRLAAMAEQLVELGLPWERFAATDGAEFGEDLSVHGYLPQLNRKQFHRALRPSEVACFVSHRRVWRHIMDNGWDGAVVLEDDIALSRDFPAALTALEMAAGRWDAVKLIASGRKIVSSVPLDSEGRWKFGYYIKTPALTAAQVITSAAARKLLEATHAFGLPVDVALQRWWKTGVRFKGIEPDLASLQEGVASDIGNRKRMPRRRLARIKQNIAYNMQAFKNALLDWK